MKSTIFLLTMLFFANFKLMASESNQGLIIQELADLYDDTVLGVVDEKVYLRSDRLCRNQNQFLLRNFQNHWTPLEELKQDSFGYYVNYRELLCPNGHTGFKKSKGIWYCMTEGCPYFFGDNFNH